MNLFFMDMATNTMGITRTSKSPGMHSMMPWSACFQNSVASPAFSNTELSEMNFVNICPYTICSPKNMQVPMVAIQAIMMFAILLKKPVSVDTRKPKLSAK